MPSCEWTSRSQCPIVPAVNYEDRSSTESTRAPYEDPMLVELGAVGDITLLGGGTMGNEIVSMAMSLLTM